MAKKSFPAMLRDTQATLGAMLERLRKHAANADGLSITFDEMTGTYQLMLTEMVEVDGGYRWQVISRTAGISVQDAFETAEYGLVGDTPPPF